MTHEEQKLEALKLAVDFSKGFNHSLSLGNKMISQQILSIAKNFEDYIKAH